MSNQVRHKLTGVVGRVFEGALPGVPIRYEVLVEGGDIEEWPGHMFEVLRSEPMCTSLRKDLVLTRADAQKIWRLCANYDAEAMAPHTDDKHKWVQPAYDRFKTIRALRGSLT